MSGRDPGATSTAPTTPRSRPFAATARDAVTIDLLSFTAHVVSNSPAVCRDLTLLYPTAVPGWPTLKAETLARFGVLESRDERGCRMVQVSVGETVVARVGSAAEAISLLESEIDAAAIRALARFVLVHAGALAVGSSGVVLPATSGGGKSTLVTALGLAGGRYLSDELAVIDPAIALWPFPKAPRLRDGGWAALQASFDLPPPSVVAPGLDGAPRYYLPVPRPFPGEGGAAVRYVVVPRRAPGATTRLEPLAKAHAVAALAEHSLNLPRHGRAGIELLARVAESAACYTLTYADVAEAVDVLLRLVAESGA